MNKAVVCAAIALVLTALAAAGCARAAVQYELAAEDMVGEVTPITTSGERTVLLVKGGGRYTEASVSVTAETAIADMETGRRLPLSSLSKGALVAVFFTGPVRESFPVQADAKSVFVIDPADLVTLERDTAAATIVKSGDVARLPAGLTFAQIFMRLGRTVDVGSGVYVARYVVDGDKQLLLGHIRLNDVCPWSGVEMLERTEPITGN